MLGDEDGVAAVLRCESSAGQPVSPHNTRLKDSTRSLLRVYHGEARYESTIVLVGIQSPQERERSVVKRSGEGRKGANSRDAAACPCFSVSFPSSLAVSHTTASLASAR